MNYQTIHDSIITRAKFRIYDSSVHQLHHITPRHEDRTSTEVVPLTFKEHMIVHHLRWKITNTLGNKLAYFLMRGVADIDKAKLLSSLGGQIGGANTKKNKSGIFSDMWSHAEEARHRWETGIINKSQFNDFEHCSRAGAQTRQKKKGIFSDEWDRGAQLKEEWASGARDGQKERCASIGLEVSMKATWTNGIENIKSAVYPGAEWSLGQVSKKTGVVSLYTKYRGKTIDEFIKESEYE